MAKKLNREKQNPAVMLIPAGTLIGIGIGFMTGYLLSGLMIGIGVGFMLVGLTMLNKKG